MATRSPSSETSASTTDSPSFIATPQSDTEKARSRCQDVASWPTAPPRDMSEYAPARQSGDVTRDLRVGPLRQRDHGEAEVCGQGRRNVPPAGRVLDEDDIPRTELPAFALSRRNGGDLTDGAACPLSTPGLAGQRRHRLPLLCRPSGRFTGRPDVRRTASEASGARPRRPENHG